VSAGGEGIDKGVEVAERSLPHSLMAKEDEGARGPVFTVHAFAVPDDKGGRWRRKVRQRRIGAAGRRVDIRGIDGSAVRRGAEQRFG